MAVNNTSLSQIPTLTKYALHQLYFLQFAKQNSNSISYYLLAGSSYGRETRKLLAEALGFVHRNMNSWSERNSNNDHLFVSVSYRYVLSLSFSPQIINCLSLLLPYSQQLLDFHCARLDSRQQAGRAYIPVDGPPRQGGVSLWSDDCRPQHFAGLWAPAL